MHIISIIILWLLFLLIIKQKFRYILFLLILISLWKELFDKYYRHTFFSIHDLYADILWIIIVYLIYIISKSLYKK